VSPKYSKDFPAVHKNGRKIFITLSPIGNPFILRMQFSIQNKINRTYQGKSSLSPLCIGS